MINLALKLKQLNGKKNSKADLYIISKLIEKECNKKIKHIRNINDFLKENNLPYFIQTKLDTERFIVVDAEFVENPQYRKRYYDVLNF